MKLYARSLGALTASYCRINAHTLHAPLSIISGMTYPRSHLIDPHEGVYHVCSRCVRRAWLCGTDEQTGLNFDHRKQWLEERILALTAIFGVDLYGYAIMSNHYHLVVSLNAEAVESWTDAMVVDKWLSLCARRRPDKASVDKQNIERVLLLNNPPRLIILRQRLGSVSWLMRFINEPLARMANIEDGCKGRFWEGRFKSQRLLDENAILACMIYIDLNPVRAGVVDDVIDAEHTALAHRIAVSEENSVGEMTAINCPNPLPFKETLTDYIALARWTANVQRSIRYGGKPANEAVLQSSRGRLAALMPMAGCWQRASGSSQSLKDYACSIGQCWIKAPSIKLLI